MPPPVAAEVAIHAVVGPVEPEVRRDEQREDAAGNEQALDLEQRAEIVPDVLEHVHRDHRVEALLRELLAVLGREATHVREPEAALGPMRAAPGRVGEDLGLDVDPVDEFRAFDQLDDPAKAAADLEDAPAEEGLELLELPAQVGPVDLVEAAVALEPVRGGVAS